MGNLLSDDHLRTENERLRTSISTLHSTIDDMKTNVKEKETISKKNEDLLKTELQDLVKNYNKRVMALKKVDKELQQQIEIKDGCIKELETKIKNYGVALGRIDTIVDTV